jgi:hypothetical protein
LDIGGQVLGTQNKGAEGGISLKKEPHIENQGVKIHVALGKYPCPDLWLATAYVPPQDYGKQFPAEEALEKGTLWPDLYSPYPSDP